MPYSSMEDVNPAIKGIDPPVTLGQANMIARMADGMKNDPSIDNEWATAIGSFKKNHVVKNGKWMKRSELSKEYSLDDLSWMVTRAWKSLYEPDDEHSWTPLKVFSSFVVAETMDGMLKYPYTMTDAGINFGSPIQVEMMYSEVMKATRDELQAARDSRAKKYGIAAKTGGALTPPSGYPGAESDYGDPVNYKYPIDSSHILPARQYFNHEGQMGKGGYTSAEWAVIGKRIAKASGGGYSYKGGKVVSAEAVSKGEEFEYTVPLLKADEERRLVYGVVMVPDKFDKESDSASGEEIEKAAHAYLARGLTRSPDLIDNQHLEVLDFEKAHPVESYLAPVDFSIGEQIVTKGSWVLVTHVPDDEMWELVKSGKRRAYSIRGWGKRTPVN